MSRRVLLHVGTPKTGTSYLQHVLFRNRARPPRARDRLPRRPVRRPLPGRARPDADAVGWAQVDAIGAWDRLARPVRGWDETTVISHEILATASRSQVGRALESLGRGHGTEVHLVLSVRDLVRQIPAEWQENVKHRAALTYGAFLDRIQDPRRERPDRHVVLGRAGDPRHPRAVGPRPAARAGAPGDGPARGRGARPAVEAVRHRVRARRHRRSSSTASGSTRPSASPRPR